MYDSGEYLATVYDAWKALLEAPDPPDLPRRGYYLTQQGDPHRWRWYRLQPNYYAAHRRHDQEEGRA